MTAQTDRDPTTREAVAMREHMERKIFELLRQYQEATGLNPTRVDLRSVNITGAGHDSTRLLEVRVTVEL